MYPFSGSGYLQKRIDHAHKRYLSAIKTLAQVRRLQVPVSVQVNVVAQGGQQVNIGTVSTGASGPLENGNVSLS